MTTVETARAKKPSVRAPTPVEPTSSMVVHAVGARACDQARRERGGEGRGGGGGGERSPAVSPWNMVRRRTQKVGQGCHGDAAARMLLRTFAAADAPASCVKGMALRKGCRQSEEPLEFVDTIIQQTTNGPPKRAGPCRHAGPRLGGRAAIRGCPESRMVRSVRSSRIKKVCGGG